MASELDSKETEKVLTPKPIEHPIEASNAEPIGHITYLETVPIVSQPKEVEKITEKQEANSASSQPSAAVAKITEITLAAPATAVAPTKRRSA